MGKGRARELVLDVGAVASPAEMHALLSSQLRFPPYYGNNWDAFDECVSEIERPVCIRVVGLDVLGRRLPREAAMLRKCLEVASSEAPAGEFELYVA